MLLAPGKIIKMNAAVDTAVVARTRDLCLDLVDGRDMDKANLETGLADPAFAERTRTVVERLFRSRLAEGLRRLVPGRLTVIATYCTVRYQSGSHLDGRIGWHFDANFVGWDAPALTVWLALEDVGVDRPAVEFCIVEDPSRIREMERAWQTKFVGLDRTFSDSEVDLLAGPERRHITPTLAPGDALIFAPATLHRTQIGIADPKPRISLELRLYGSERVPNLINNKPIFTLIEDQPGGIPTVRDQRADTAV